MCASRIQEVRCAQKIIHSVPVSVVKDIACLPRDWTCTFWVGLKTLYTDVSKLVRSGISRLFRRFDGLLDRVKGKAEFSVIAVPKP